MSRVRVRTVLGKERCEGVKGFGKIPLTYSICSIL